MRVGTDPFSDLAALTLLPFCAFGSLLRVNCTQPAFVKKELGREQIIVPNMEAKRLAVANR